jgi:hypothetical protein
MRFKEWMEQNELEEGLMQRVPQGVKRWGKSLAGAAALAGGMPTMTHDPSPMSYNVSADYGNFMDDKANDKYQRQLQQVQRGENPSYDDEGDVEVGTQNSIVNDEMPPNDNFLMSRSQKGGSNLFYPDGFQTQGTGWHTPGRNDYAQAQQQAAQNGFDKMKARPGMAGFKTVDPAQLKHQDVTGLRTYR